MPAANTKIQQLQSRINELLAGNVEPARDGIRGKNSERFFSEFLPGDVDRANLIEALCEKIADEQGGLEGLEAAIDYMYENLGRFPLGMMEYAAKLFLTHYQPARENLLMPSLEERQTRNLHSSPSPFAPRS